MYAEHSLALVQVRQIQVYLTVKTACTQQSLVKYIHTVGGCQNDYAAVGAESVHLSEQLVQGVLTLVIAAHCGVLAAGTAYGVNLINEYDAWSLLFCLAEQVTHA